MEVINLCLPTGKKGLLPALYSSCAMLTAKMHREPQFNRKVKYNLELQEKRKELEKILE